MRVRPRGFDDSRLLGVLGRNWAFTAADLRYAPIGYGSHHWVAITARGERRFVTVDELQPPDQQQRLRRLRAAMRSAVALRDEGGVEFVVAPLPTVDGAAVLSVDDAFAVTVMPFLDGAPWPHGAEATGASRAVLTGMLARLHDATPVAAPFAARDDFEINARAHLETALARVDEPWEAGPYAPGCRQLLAAAATTVRQRLSTYDRLVSAIQARDEPFVVTHGEPKPDNLLVTDTGPALVDWDTTLLAPAARDLWWLHADDPDAQDRCTQAIGRPVHRDDMALYRLRWDLTDVALFVHQLRRPHLRDADTDVAWRALTHLLQPGLQGRTWA